MIAAKHPSSVQAHCMPMPSNICVENRGNPAANDDRRMMLAATADAALYLMLLTWLERVCEGGGHIHREICVNDVVETR